MRQVFILYFHYGSHTEIGDRFFANFNLTIQDDGKVKIGDDCNFGPGVTIGTGCVIGAGSASEKCDRRFFGQRGI